MAARSFEKPWQYRSQFPMLLRGQYLGFPSAGWTWTSIRTAAVAHARKIRVVQVVLAAGAIIFDSVVVFPKLYLCTNGSGFELSNVGLCRCGR